jgi:pimeloyl-ACP methyl ester carboxylesterase
LAKISTIVRFTQPLAKLSSLVAPHASAGFLERYFLTPSRREMQAWEIDCMAKAHTRIFSFDDDRKFPVYFWGSGPVVLLVHGWSGRASQLTPLVPGLLKKGFQVVTFDAPAHGEAEGKITGMPELAAALKQVADHFGSIEAIVAHSLGGSATTLAMSRGLSARKLVYISPPENVGAYLYRTTRLFGFSRKVARISQELLEERFSFTFENSRGTSLAPQMRTPLLVIHDVKDRQVNYEDACLWAKSWPKATLMSTEGLGHLRILRDSLVIKAALDFVGRRESKKMDKKADLLSGKGVMPSPYQESDNLGQTI